jgi:hypothetical protein
MNGPAATRRGCQKQHARCQQRPGLHNRKLPGVQEASTGAPSTTCAQLRACNHVATAPTCHAVIPRNRRNRGIDHSMCDRLPRTLQSLLLAVNSTDNHAQRLCNPPIAAAARCMRPPTAALPATDLTAIGGLGGRQSRHGCTLFNFTWVPGVKGAGSNPARGIYGALHRHQGVWATPARKQQPAGSRFACLFVAAYIPCGSWNHCCTIGLFACMLCLCPDLCNNVHRPARVQLLAAHAIDMLQAMTGCGCS